jgi:hypothetical protein
MNWRLAVSSICTGLVLTAVACSRQSAKSELRVEIPPGFSGYFVLEMGVREASPLEKDGKAYVVAVPRTGKVQTSTFLENPTVKYKNASEGSIWGFSNSKFTTGDGISVGGKIEFFVGTQEQFEAEQNKKNKSGGFPTAESDLSEM